jgi:beta-lactamase class A
MNVKLIGIALLTALLLVVIPIQPKGKQGDSYSIPPVTTSGLPLQIPDEFIQPLRNMEDDDLQGKLEKLVAANPKWKQLAQQKRMAVGLVDLQNPYQIRFASINGDEMMYAASLPKIAILLAAMDAIEKGELKESSVVYEKLNAMIRRSNNQASTWMIDQLGYDKIESVLTDPRYELYDKKYGGGLWVGKRYAASGARNPDPMKGLSHAASVSQVCRFYYLLAMGKLVNYDRSKQMLGIMDRPGLHHKFMFTLDRIAPEARVFRKSGSWRDFHSDSVMVWGKNPNRRYILVALTQDAEGEKIIRNLVKTAEKALEINS